MRWVAVMHLGPHISACLVSDARSRVECKLACLHARTHSSSSRTLECSQHTDRPVGYQEMHRVAPTLSRQTCCRALNDFRLCRRAGCGIHARAYVPACSRNEGAAIAHTCTGPRDSRVPAKLAHMMPNTRSIFSQDVSHSQALRRWLVGAGGETRLCG